MASLRTKMAVSGLIIGLLSSLPAKAHGGESKAIELCKGFVPDRYAIKVMPSRASKINKNNFIQILDKIEKVYQPEFKKRKLKFRIEKDWQNSTANAYASADQKDPANRFILMNGGLALHPQMTLDSFVLTACHEIGHHLGGKPFIENEVEGYGTQVSWASTEGQADYFGAAKCFRKIFTEVENLTWFKSQKNIDKKIEGDCNQSYSVPSERYLCYRTAMASLAASQTLASLMAQVDHTPYVAPKLSTPDVTKVTHTLTVNKFIFFLGVLQQTESAHPKAQCRLDTYYRGTLCNEPPSTNLSDSSIHPGACTRKKGSKAGDRPACWFNEADYALDTIQ